MWTGVGSHTRAPILYLHICCIFSVWIRIVWRRTLQCNDGRSIGFITICLSDIKHVCYGPTESSRKYESILDLEVIQQRLVGSINSIERKMYVESHLEHQNASKKQNPLACIYLMDANYYDFPINPIHQSYNPILSIFHHLWSHYKVCSKKCNIHMYSANA